MIRAGCLYKTLNNFLVENREILDVNQKECIMSIIERCLKTPIIDIPQTKIIERMSKILLNDKTLIKSFKKELKIAPKTKYKKQSLKYQFSVNNILNTRHLKYGLILLGLIGKPDGGRMKYFGDI